MSQKGAVSVPPLSIDPKVNAAVSLAPATVTSPGGHTSELPTARSRRDSVMHDNKAAVWQLLLVNGAADDEKSNGTPSSDIHSLSPETSLGSAESPGMKASPFGPAVPTGNEQAFDTIRQIGRGRVAELDARLEAVFAPVLTEARQLFNPDSSINSTSPTSGPSPPAGDAPPQTSARGRSSSVAASGQPTTAADAFRRQKRALRRAIKRVSVSGPATPTETPVVPPVLATEANNKLATGSSTNRSRSDSIAKSPMQQQLDVPYNLQGNPDLYSEENLELRLANKTAPEVVASVDAWWMSLPKATVKGAGVTSPATGKRRSVANEGLLLNSSRRQSQSPRTPMSGRKPSVASAISPSDRELPTHSSSTEQPPTGMDEPQVITEEIYRWFTRKLFFRLMPNGTEAEFDSIATADWRTECLRANKKAASMSLSSSAAPGETAASIAARRWIAKDDFAEYAFDLADVWCETTSAAEYAQFISACIVIIDTGAPYEGSLTVEPTSSATTQGGAARRRRSSIINNNGPGGPSRRGGRRNITGQAVRLDHSKAVKMEAPVALAKPGESVMDLNGSKRQSLGGSRNNNALSPRTPSMSLPNGQSPRMAGLSPQNSSMRPPTGPTSPTVKSPVGGNLGTSLFGSQVPPPLPEGMSPSTSSLRGGIQRVGGESPKTSPNASMQASSVLLTATGGASAMLLSPKERRDLATAAVADATAELQASTELATGAIDTSLLYSVINLAKALEQCEDGRHAEISNAGEQLSQRLTLCSMELGSQRGASSNSNISVNGGDQAVHELDDALKVLVSKMEKITQENDKWRVERLPARDAPIAKLLDIVASPEVEIDPAVISEQKKIVTDGWLDAKIQQESWITELKEISGTATALIQAALDDLNEPGKPLDGRTAGKRDALQLRLFELNLVGASLDALEASNQPIPEGSADIADAALQLANGVEQTHALGRKEVTSGAHPDEVTDADGDDALKIALTGLEDAARSSLKAAEDAVATLQSVQDRVNATAAKEVGQCTAALLMFQRAANSVVGGVRDDADEQESAASVEERVKKLNKMVQSAKDVGAAAVAAAKERVQKHFDEVVSKLRDAAGDPERAAELLRASSLFDHEASASEPAGEGGEPNDDATDNVEENFRRLRHRLVKKGAAHLKASMTGASDIWQARTAVHDAVNEAMAHAHHRGLQQVMQAWAPDTPAAKKLSEVQRTRREELHLQLRSQTMEGNASLARNTALRANLRTIQRTVTAAGTHDESGLQLVSGGLEETDHRKLITESLRRARAERLRNGSVALGEGDAIGGAMSSEEYVAARRARQLRIQEMARLRRQREKAEREQRRQARELHDAKEREDREADVIRKTAREQQRRQSQSTQGASSSASRVVSRGSATAGGLQDEAAVVSSVRDQERRKVEHNTRLMQHLQNQVSEIHSVVSNTVSDMRVLRGAFRRERRALRSTLSRRMQQLAMPKQQQKIMSPRTAVLSAPVSQPPLGINASPPVSVRTNNPRGSHTGALNITPPANNGLLLTGSSLAAKGVAAAGPQQPQPGQIVLRTRRQQMEAALEESAGRSGGRVSRTNSQQRDGDGSARKTSDSNSSSKQPVGGKDFTSAGQGFADRQRSYIRGKLSNADVYRSSCHRVAVGVNEDFVEQQLSAKQLRFDLAVVRATNFNLGSAQAITDVLLMNPVVKFMARSVGFSADDLIHLAEALAEHPFITTIDVSRNEVPKEAAAKVVAGFEQLVNRNRSVTRIVMQNCGIPVDDVKRIQRLCAENEAHTAAGRCEFEILQSEFLEMDTDEDGSVTFADMTKRVGKWKTSGLWPLQRTDLGLDPDAVSVALQTTVLDRAGAAMQRILTSVEDSSTAKNTAEGEATKYDLAGFVGLIYPLFSAEDIKRKLRKFGGGPDVPPLPTLNEIHDFIVAFGTFSAGVDPHLTLQQLATGMNQDLEAVEVAYHTCDADRDGLLGVGEVFALMNA